MDIVEDPDWTLALDLEGTLISNAMSCFPRAGLFAFLECVREMFGRVVIFSAVSPERSRAILECLADEGSAPDWARDMEIVVWRGDTKDLAFIERAAIERTLLVDDIESYVHPGQDANWIRISPFESPYSEMDRELARIADVLRQRLAAS